jgi:hypothetical protein
MGPYPRPTRFRFGRIAPEGGDLRNPESVRATPAHPALPYSLVQIPQSGFFARAADRDVRPKLETLIMFENVLVERVVQHVDLAFALRHIEIEQIALGETVNVPERDFEGGKPAEHGQSEISGSAQGNLQRPRRNDGDMRLGEAVTRN